MLLLLLFSSWVTYTCPSKGHWQDPSTTTPFLTSLPHTGPSRPREEWESHFFTFIFPSLDNLTLPWSKTKLQTEADLFYSKIMFCTWKSLKLLSFALVIKGLKLTSFFLPLILDLDSSGTVKHLSEWFCCTVLIQIGGRLVY